MLTDKFLRLPRVSDAVGLSPATIWRLIKDEQFPAPTKLSSQAVGWLESEISRWIQERKAAGGAA